MSAPEVIVVSSNVSNNCMGRVLLLSSLVRRFADVRVVGANLNPGVAWGPGVGFGIEVREIAVTNVFQYGRAKAWLRNELQGAKVVISKPHYTSLGLARAAGVRNDRMLLDIDDWEVGLFSGAPWHSQLWDFVRPGKVNSFKTMQRLDRTIADIPHRIVSNGWLRERYGGVVLPHVRDTEVLRPDPAARARARAELEMGDRFWVGFVGTIRGHKGVDVLLEAIARLPDDIGLYLAGVDETDAYTRTLLASVKAQLSPQRLRLVPTFDFARLPHYLSAADMLCIPSRASEAAAGQIPAKLFDALAMGLPVVVSDLNDMGSIVEGVGQVVTPGDVVALAQAIDRFRSDAALREACGRAARVRALADYSYESAAKQLEALLESIPVALPR